MCLFTLLKFIFYHLLVQKNLRIHAVIDKTEDMKELWSYKNATECKIYQGMVLHESDKVLPNMRYVPDVNI